MSKPFGIIYKATNLINDKCYIGQTISSLAHRKRQHKCEAVNNYSNMILSKSIRKYGWENFSWEIICECSARKELNEKETFYIENYNTYTPNGYNLTKGGDGISGFHWSEESKQKQRERNLGKKLSEEHKKNISNGTIGKCRKYSDETINKSIECRNGGMMFVDIAEEMNIPVETIKWWYKRNSRSYRKV